MNVKDAIEKLSSKDELAVEYFNKIPNKNKKTNKVFLESLTKLSYILYIDNKIDDCLSILDVLCDISFDNNYDYWTWGEFSIALKFFIYRSNGDMRVLNHLLKIVDDSLNYGDELQKLVKHNVHNRFLSGGELDSSILKDDSIDNVEERNNDRLVYFMKLLKLRMFIDSSSVSKSRLDGEISMCMNYLHKFIVEGNSFRLSPFK